MLTTFVSVTMITNDEGHLALFFPACPSQRLLTGRKVIMQPMANLHKKHMANLHISYLTFLSTECSIKYISQYFSMIWIAATKINIRLHKASIFFYSHVDKSIENLKNTP